MVQGLRYSTLTHDFDRQLLIDRALAIPRDQYVPIAAVRSDAFEIAPKEIADRAPYSVFEDGKLRVVPGDLSTYTYCALTHPPGRPELLNVNNVRIGDTYGRPYMVYDQEPWEWRTDLDLNEIRAELARLPFEYILRVRIIALWEGEHLGHVHRDCVPELTQPWQARGFGVINLNLLDGGSSLNFLIGGEIRSTNDPCFTFDESLWHGTTLGDQLRLQINVVGKIDADRMVPMLHPLLRP